MKRAYKSLVESIGEITGVDYFWDEDMSESDILFTALEDMKLEYKDKCNEFDDFRNEVEDNFRPLTRAEQIGSAAYRGC